MIRGFIVDDEEPARDRLRRLLSNAGASDASGTRPEIEIVGEAERRRRRAAADRRAGA